MPLYGFRCPSCELEFEVSRPMSRSAEAAFCVMDGTECERVITMPMTFIRSDPNAPQQPAKAAPSSQWSHGGHSHGYGVGGHSHGPATPPPTPAAN